MTFLYFGTLSSSPFLENIKMFLKNVFIVCFAQLLYTIVDKNLCPVFFFLDIVIVFPCYYEHFLLF